MLCCILNYAPWYRKAIFSEMDAAFEAQFCFGANLPGRTGIEKLDYGMFRRAPKEFRSLTFGGKFPWYCGVIWKPFSRKYTSFLITAEFNWAWFPFLVLCKLMGKPVYGWGHGIKSLGKHSRLKRFFYNSLAGMFIYSDGARRRMAELGFDKEKIYPIHNSIELFEGNVMRSNIYKEHFGNDDPVIIFSGRLTPQKQLDMLVEAFCTLNREGTHCNLVLVGDGPVRESLESLAGECRSRLWLVGACYDNERLAELNVNAHLCVCPGNVGLSAIQAMGYGLPVVTHDDFESQMPEYEVVEEGLTGGLFRRGDVESLIETMRSWIGKVADPMEREAAGRRCRGVIDSQWNASWQIEVMKKVMGGSSF